MRKKLILGAILSILLLLCTCKVQAAGEWDDKAKITVEQGSDARDYVVKISDVEKTEGHTYRYFIGKASENAEFSNDLPQLLYDSEKKVFSSTSISKYLELTDEHYIYVYENYLDENAESISNLVLNKKKIEKPAQKLYTDVFYVTMISKLTDDAICNTQILFNTPWADGTIRKVHLRVGRISDNNILKGIQNKKSNAFSELLKYAKEANAFYDKTVNSNDKNATVGGIIWDEPNTPFAASNITDNGYYFLYAVLEDEDGKYVKTEGVTLAVASKEAADHESFTMFFYGSNDFSWKTFDEEPEPTASATPTKNPTEKPTNAPTSATTDKTTMSGRIPQAGMNSTVLIIVGASLMLGIVSVIKYKKYNV